MWTEKVNEALQTATILHQGQVRKDGITPYIMHPMAVAMIVSEYTSNEDVVAAALLHDVLEDVDEDDYGVVNMGSQFGSAVLGLVQAVSEPTDIAGTRKDSWKQRKIAYLDHLARSKNPDAMLISAADLLHNTYSYLQIKKTTDANSDQKLGFNASAQERLWFARKRIALLCEHVDARMADNLTAALRQYELALQ